MSKGSSYRELKEQLQQFVDAAVPSYYPLKSRVHHLRTMSTPSTQVYLKRDDELSFGVSGSKLRKYSTLIPYLKRRGIKTAALIGGAYSNNVLGLSQILLENGVRPILLVRKPGNPTLQGNYLFTRMLIPPENVKIIDRECWGDVERIAQEYAASEDSIVIPEGAFMEEALAGAITLSTDIFRNEEELGKEFAHVFVDAGSGLQAIALILGMSYCRSSTVVHVVLLALSPEEFKAKLEQMMFAFKEMIGNSRPFHLNYRLHQVGAAKSFGSVNGKGITNIIEFARAEGVFLDPIYSGKLVNACKQILLKKNVCGDALIVHSGGGLALSGFQSQIEKRLIDLN